MPGPNPKDPSARARRNKVSTSSRIAIDPKLKVPALPDGVDWHPMTDRWWADIWASPMAPEYVEADHHGMFRIAMLVNDFWTADNAKSRAEVQIRLEKADADFGTNPMARRRLQWEVERTEDAQAAGKTRRARAATPSAPSADPRAILRAV
jgi:hypothetical protein